jgi:hypothetical protein
MLLVNPALRQVTSNSTANSAASGPLLRVLSAVQKGARSSTDIAGIANLSREMTELTLEHLARGGYLLSRELISGCPASGCGSCAIAEISGAPCAAAKGE